MAEITTALVRELRERTGAGMMDCKKALSENGGDIEASTDWLRKKGLAAAAKKAGRQTSEGLVGLAVEGKVGACVEVNSETDFVARNETFRAFARDVALQVAAGRLLQFVSEDEIPADYRAAEIDTYRGKAANEGKPENMLDKIAEGMWNKSLTDTVLLKQPSIKPEHDGKTIETLRAELSGTIGENIEVKRFARFEVGAE
jgi:elongation factor Ts